MFFLQVALVLACCLVLGWAAQKCKLPALLAYLVVGILLGPELGNQIPAPILELSPELRKFALVVILLRAGLSLDVTKLKSMGRPALLLSFFPALTEILAVGCFAPLIFHIPVLDALILGSVLAAVSPAVVVPRMIDMIEKDHGTKKQIPQTIIAGSSFDDIFAILLFTSFTTLKTGGSIQVMSILSLPISIILGIAAGCLLGWLTGILFKKIKLNDNFALIFLTVIALACVGLEAYIEANFKGKFAFSGLLATITLAMVHKYFNPTQSIHFGMRYNQLWSFAEIFLFLLVGAATPIAYAGKAFAPALLLLLCSLFFRSLAVLVSFIKTPLNAKERTFCAISYLPKATVQAAIGAVPLAMGIETGGLILSVAVVSILVTAPVSAFLIDLTRPILVKD